MNAMIKVVQRVVALLDVEAAQCWERLRPEPGAHVNHTAVVRMQCTSTACFSGAAQRVADLLDPEAAARWERLELDQSLARMPDVVHCPRCATPCIEDGGDHCAQCPKCLFAFCTLCNDSWHGRSIQARARVVTQRLHNPVRHAAACSAWNGSHHCACCAKSMLVLCIFKSV